MEFNEFPDASKTHSILTPKGEQQQIVENTKETIILCKATDGPFNFDDIDRQNDTYSDIHVIREDVRKLGKLLESFLDVFQEGVERFAEILEWKLCAEAVLDCTAAVTSA